MGQKLSRLPKPVYIVTTSYDKLVRDWFEQTYCTRENGVKIYAIEHIENDEFKQWPIRGMVERAAGRRGEEHIGHLRLYHSGRVELCIRHDCGYLFDDVEAIYRKMATA